MNKRKKLRNIRPKALFGIGETGALIALTAAEVAGHAGQAAAQYFAAKSQGENMLKQSQMQVDALKEQNENNNQLQRDMMQFTKEQNDETRRIMMENNMNNQLLAGSLATQDRREASKTVLKNGGRKRRKLRNAYSSLQGGNIPFRVTDGGTTIPIGQTPEGYDVYQVLGDSHKQYHKAQGGKYKSGVGIKYPDGETIEVEGGEKQIVTPNDALVLSNQTFIEPSSGLPFNPSEAVDYGMDPLQAHATQEFIKDYYGLSDDGSNKTPVKRRLRSCGGCTIPIRRRAKNGTRKEIASVTNRKKASLGSWLKSGSWTVAPTIGAVGNFLGAGLSSLGLGLGSSYLGRRVGQAGDLLANAYGQLQGVNMSDVFGDNARASFNTGFYMPAVRSSYVNVNPQIEKASRDNRLQLRGINNNTLSSAARLQRSGMSNAALDETRSKYFADKANREERIKQANLDAINEAGETNAGLSIEYLKDFSAQRADLAKFNANVANERILGAAEARANAMQTRGQIGAQAMQGIGNALGSAVSQSALGFANAYNDKLTRDYELDLAKLGANQEGLTTWYANSKNVSDSEAYDYAINLIESAKTTSGPARANAIKNANIILSSRGYPTVDEYNLFNYRYNDLSRTNLRNIKPMYNFNLPTGLGGVRLS